MPRLVFALLLTTLTSACLEQPDLSATPSPAPEAEFPILAPLDTLQLPGADTTRGDALSTDLQSRAAQLRNRAAAVQPAP